MLNTFLNTLFAVAACWNVAGFFVAWVTWLHRPSTAPLADRAVDAGMARTLLDLEERERVVGLREQHVRAEAEEQHRTRDQQVAAELALQVREGELRALSLVVLEELAALEKARQPAAITLPMDWATPMLPDRPEPTLPAWLSDTNIFRAIGDGSPEPVGDDALAEEEQPSGPETTTGEPEEWTPDPVAYAALVDRQQPAAADWFAVGCPENGDEHCGGCACHVAAPCQHCTEHVREREIDAEVMEFAALGEPVVAVQTEAIAVELAVEARHRVERKLNKRKLAKAGGRR